MINLNHWFVVPVEGEAGARYLVKAADKVSALAVILFRYTDLNPGPVETLEQHCAARALDPLNELQYTVGCINPETVVTGTAVLMQ